jgi:arylformamidase
MTIYDISVPLGEDTPVYPGDPPIEIIEHTSMADGDSSNVTHLSLGAHSGTHIDAPFHFSRQGKRIDELALDIFFGQAQVVEVSARDGYVTRDELIEQVEEGTERLLLKTANSRLWQKSGFEKGFVHLSLKAAEWIVKAGIKLVGIDYLSIEKFDSPDHAVHRMLLENSVVILEGINLFYVPPGTYKLICLPLRIKGGDGSPARAILIRK